MTRKNLAYNPSVRLGLDGYTPINGATLSVQSGRGFYGADYLQVAKSASNASGVQLKTISLPSTDALSYSFSAYVQVPITNPATELASLAIRVIWQDANGQTISEDSTDISVVTPSADWTRLTGIATSPDGAVYALVSITQLIAGTAGALFNLDAILFEQSSFVGGYLDNISEKLKQHIVNTALTPLSQPIPQGIQLNADVIFNDLVLNTIDEDNIIWICTDIDGWWNPAEAESPDIERGAEDGSYDVSGRYKARILNLSGAFLVDDPSQVRAARDKLIAAINVVRRGAWLRTNEEPTKAAYVRLSGRPVIETVNARGRTEFQIGLKASDPVKYHWNDSDLNGFTTVSPVPDAQARQTNLVLNPSLEGTDISAWSVSNSTIARSTVVARSGSNSLLVTPSSTTGGVSHNYSLTVGTTITWSVWVYTTVAKNLQLAMANHTIVSPTVLVAPGVWTRLSLSGVSTSENKYFILGLDSTQPFYIDDVLLVSGVYSGDYFSGDTPDSPEYLYSWTGTPNASTSDRFLGRTIDTNAVNIGTSAVTALFDITGPMGVGSTIYNHNTEETLTLTKELRGTGTLATLVTKQLFNNIATITTSAPHKLLVGDKIHVQGPGAPFDSVHEELEVTHVGLIPPYSFSYARVFPDIDEVPTTGTVSLAHEDVLSIDTYNKSVIFNGSELGNRSRIDTLADWIKLAPGDNLLGFTDNPVHRKVINKDLKSNKITLTTDQSHMFLPGETLSVDLATEAKLARKSLTNNRITLTTTEPHGFSKGDSISVVSTETSTVTQKQVTSNVATLTTAVAGGFSVGDILSVTLPTTGTVAKKAVTANVATLTSTAPHGFTVGDSVTVALATSAEPLQKSLTNNVATITTRKAHGFSVGDTVNVVLNTGTDVTNKYVNGSQINLTTDIAHGFSVGDQVTIQLPVSATPTGTRQMAGNTSYLTTINTVSAHNFSVGDQIKVDLKISATQTITNRSATTTTCTLTTATHNFSVGETIVVSGVSTRYNGTFTITAVTATTFSYASAGTAESSTASGGSVTNRSIQGYSGPAYIETIPSATSFTYLFYGQDTATSSTLYGSSPTITNLSNQKLNGSHTLTSVSTQQLTYSI